MSGLLFSFLLFCFFCVLSYIYGPDPKPTRKPISANDWDVVPIGVVYTQYVKPSQPIVKQTVSRKPKVKTKTNNKHPLFDDAVAALVGLGEKSSVAKKQAKEILESNNIGTIEEFIQVTFSRN